MRRARSWVSERTSRTIQGAKITPSTTTAASTASSTSRAAPRAPVAWRKTNPAAITSATPRPVREMAAAARRLSAASAARGGSALTAARVGGASAAGSGPPSDWRHSSAPPLAIRTSGHTTASENQIPSARNVSRAASNSSPVPSATSTAARPVGSRLRAEPDSPVGIRIHASR